MTYRAQGFPLAHQGACCPTVLAEVALFLAPVAVAYHLPLVATVATSKNLALVALVEVAAYRQTLPLAAAAQGLSSVDRPKRHDSADRFQQACQLALRAELALLAQSRQPRQMDQPMAQALHPYLHY